MLNALLEHAARTSVTAQVEYVFVEERRDRFEALRRSIADLRAVSPFPANISVQARLGEFHQQLPVIAPELDINRPPTFAFIDPFGWSDAPMELTSSILGIDHWEALVYVPLPFIARFINDPAVEDSLMLLYGGDAWKAAKGVPPSSRIQVLRTCFEQAMLEHCSYVRAFDIRPDGNRGYTLFFGTRHLRGLEKMKAVLWNVDPAGGCRYTDTTDWQQEVLFKPEPDYRQLESILRSHFGTRRFAIDEAERFVLTETPFAKTHLKSPVLKPAEAAGRLVVETSPRQRRGTYPSGTLLRFVR
jgi:three-Cys-motif partner protein